MPNDIGKLRRSTVVGTFAPGAVVDFRADGAAISGVVAGLEEWDASFRPPGLANPQRVHEPRLEKKLRVKGFRLPPVVDESWRDDNGNADSRRLVATRFPKWLQCPNCDRIATKWADEPGKAFRYCGPCTKKAPGKKKVHAVPVRFVMACPAGHLDDFPWHWWVQHRPDCQNRLDLKLKAERPGLAGIIVSCSSCKARRSLDGIFSEKTWAGRFACSGSRPWLYSAEKNACLETMRAVQRGASNLYFPVIASALSIPAWSDGLQEALGLYWHPLVNAAAEDRAQFIKFLANDLKTTLEELGLTPAQLADEIQRRLEAIQDPAIDDIRGAEYRQFTLAMGYRKESDREFETRIVPLPPSLAPYFSRIVRVVRLREVRALKGFTRIVPPGDEDDAKMAPIAQTPPPHDWLPAIEVRGEGIFLEFSMERLQLWENDECRSRAAQVSANWHREWVSRAGDPKKCRVISARFLLLHTFAHALIRQLTLDCGYSSASLRERLYVRDDPDSPMAGVLIYTGTSDADGTLGGLQRQGEAIRIVRSIPAAIRSMEWCSSDPLCIEGVLSGVEGLSKSACHACVLAPETSCEEFNRFLDRALLVGTPDKKQLGYFESLLGN